MIRFIAALDDNQGIANDHGIPWMGKIPADVKQYREHIYGFPVIMGLGHYYELNEPYPNSDNYVAVLGDEPLKAGYNRVSDAHDFLTQFKEDIWNIGGALLYSSTLDLADELYLTRVQGEYGCTKFFPQFDKDFTRVESSPVQEENGISFHFERWVRAKN